MNKKIRLTKPGQIKRFLADVMNKVNNNEMPEATGRALGYLSSILLKAIEVEDLQKKVKELEELVESMQNE